MRFKYLFILSLMCFAMHKMSSQSLDCIPQSSETNAITSGELFFNYGAQTKLKEVRYQTSIAVGQNFIGFSDNNSTSTSLGFYNRFLLAPFKPSVIASQGELLDRIQINWEIDALGPAASDGFNIYRDDIFLANVNANIRSFNDFNVIAGRPYTYKVTALNAFGEGSAGEAIGFQVPNGVVTGLVESQQRNAVEDVIVSLNPSLNYSLKFDSLHGAKVLRDENRPFLPLGNSAWTISFWCKTLAASGNKGMLDLNFNLAFRNVSENGTHGIFFNTAAGELKANFPAATKNDWHHVTVTKEQGGLTRMYFDGKLMVEKVLNINYTASDLNLGASIFGGGGWDGFMDDLRIYHKTLDETEINEIMFNTASSTDEGLSRYWMMNEQMGIKAFDIKNRDVMYLCGPTFRTDSPLIMTSGKTDGTGFYTIEGVNYGTGTTFIAKPEKFFYKHKSIMLSGNPNSYIALPNFAIPAQATMELWFSSDGTNENQNLLSKTAPGNSLRLVVAVTGGNKMIQMQINNETYTFNQNGNYNLSPGFHHIAIFMDSLSGNVGLQLDGIYRGNNVFSYNTNWSDPTTTWNLGFAATGLNFKGKIDEFAVYNRFLTPTEINQHIQMSRDIQEDGLLVYFPMDEGAGTILTNMGSTLLPPGNIQNGTWSRSAVNQETTPHDFSPVTRQVTVNPSVTSVDQVDFRDLSTVAVSGYVRFEGTDCFQPKVEILVNGGSHSPAIFTDSTGKFSADFEPGFTGVLSPKFEDHTFVPAIWNITNVNSPIAGIIFTNTVKRTITGRVAGGLCELPIISNPGTPQGTVCVVKVSTTDGCLERIFQIDNAEGDFIFENLPPSEDFVIAITEHSDPTIKSYFETQGGFSIDLSEKDTLVKMLYFAPPAIEIVSGLEPSSANCNTIVLDQNSDEIVSLRAKEIYVGGDCYLDTVRFKIINGLNESERDTTITNGTLNFEFEVGLPNPSPPFFKTIQFLATTLDDRTASLTKQALITGIKSKANTFTTLLPNTPTLILRDPPGDGSQSFIEKGTTLCKTTTFSVETDGGGGIGLDVSLGGNTEVAVGVGVATILNSGPIFDIGGEAEFSIATVSENTIETCISFNSRISTSDSDLVVGKDSDVYIGDGMNILFGFADKVSFDTMTCAAATETVINIEPGNFKTTYIYSGFQIENYLIPNLKSLMAAATDSLKKAEYKTSMNSWQNILELNDTLKNNVKAIKNLSFDAGVNYEYSETSDTTSVDVKSSMQTNGFTTQTNIGYKLNEFGVVGTVSGFYSKGNGETNETNNQVGTTVGYVLADDDPGDAFSVDIAMDSIYRTPIFVTKAGQSSCPWEEDTANREAPNLQLAPGSQFVAANVPANEAAVFQFILGNLSATNEDWTYGFTAIAGSNPDGAIIKLNGQPLNNNIIQFVIPYGTSIPITLTVERGPIAYEYNGLRVALVSECELARDFALSLPNNSKFFSSIDLGVDFIRPCSEIKINVPQQDWVVFPDPLTPESDDEMRITVSGYDTKEVNFQLVRLQYRRIGGDGAWINIQSTTPGGHEAYNSNWVDFASLPNPKPAELQPNFTQFYWNTLGLVDGEYEIRAVAVCTGNASDKPGFSQYIKGRIDRQPPSLVGVPQPSDGVYHTGDEISFTFNQDINCNKLIQADLTQANNVGLYDATTGNLIDATISCVGNKIVIVPNFVNKFFENKILRAELHNIEDLTGNKNVYEQWEFYVDRNELAWLTDSIEVVKFVDETKTISAKIHNRGGYPVPYVIDSIPNWLHVFPDRGTLVANEIEEIFFTVKNDMDLGEAIEDIVLITQTGLNPFFMGGTEPLNIKARNLCRPETWVLNPAGFNIADFDHSMNFVVQLDIEGSMSLDENDIVGAYVDGQLRGIAKIEYQPSINKYLAFLTVYSNQSTGETIKFQIWDASDCKLYAYALESFPFVVNTIQGTVDQTIVLHTNTTLLRKIFLNPGWNWISLNLDMQPNNSVNSVLSTLSSPQGATIKSRTPFSQYSSLTGMWGGNLATLDSYSMYQYQSVVSDSLSLIGNYIDPLVTPIPLINGWNWISYLPTQSLKVDDALSSLTATTGDIIKSQLHFAQYRAGIGWIGNLKTMNAPNGYLLKLASTNPGFLIYPDPLQLRSDDQYSERTPVVHQYHGLTELQSTPESQLPFSHWKVDPSKYEHNMNIIAIVKEKSDTENILNSGDEVAAFVNGEVRGSSKAIYIEGLKSYMLFMTVYANSDGEQLNLKYLDSSENKEYDLTEKFMFKSNHIQGNIDTPQPLHKWSTSSVIPVGMDTAVEIYPNPFSGSLQIQYSMMKAQDVHVIVKDIHGKVVSTQVIKSGQGEQRISWVPEAGLVGGAYFITLETESDAYTEKVIYIR